jgi:hypothetical protein
MIERNQTYRSCTPGRTTRIRVLGVTPWGSGLYGSGTARVVTLTEDGREVGTRSVSLAKLHDSPFTKASKPRRTGYALEQQ